MDLLGLMRRFGMNVAWDSSVARVGEQSAKQAFYYNPSRRMTQSASYAFDTREAYLVEGWS